MGSPPSRWGCGGARGGRPGRVRAGGGGAGKRGEGGRRKEKEGWRERLGEARELEQGREGGETGTKRGRSEEEVERGKRRGLRRSGQGRGGKHRGGEGKRTRRGGRSAAQAAAAPGSWSLGPQPGLASPRSKPPPPPTHPHPHPHLSWGTVQPWKTPGSPGHRLHLETSTAPPSCPPSCVSQDCPPFRYSPDQSPGPCMSQPGRGLALDSLSRGGSPLGLWTSSMWALLTLKLNVSTWC